MNIKGKKENKNTTNECRFFLKSNFVGVNRFFVLVYSDNVNASKRYSAFRYYLAKDIFDNYNIIINGKNFYHQLLSQQGKVKTGCLLDYESMKIHYRLIALDLGKQKELDGDPKRIQ